MKNKSAMLRIKCSLTVRRDGESAISWPTISVLTQPSVSWDVRQDVPRGADPRERMSSPALRIGFGACFMEKIPTNRRTARAHFLWDEGEETEATTEGTVRFCEFSEESSCLDDYGGLPPVAQSLPRGRRVEKGEGLRLELLEFSSTRGCMSLVSTSSASGGEIMQVGGLRSVGSITTDGLGLLGCFQCCFSLTVTGLFPRTLVKASICCENFSVCISL